MIEFQDCDIIINGQGLIAPSATISSQNAIEPYPAIGKVGSLQCAKGGVVSLVEVNYLLDFAVDPFVAFISTIKQSKNSVPSIDLEIAGVQTIGYLQDFSFKIAPNLPVFANASFICYSEVSGDFVTKRNTIDYTADQNSTAHGWTSYVTSSGSIANVPTYEFDYSFKCNLKPIYVLGRQNPNQVSLLNGEESASLIRDYAFFPVFSGELVTQRLLDPNFENHLIINSISYSWEEPSAQTFLFDFTRAKITNTRIDLALDDFVKTQINFRRFI